MSIKTAEDIGYKWAAQHEMRGYPMSLLMGMLTRGEKPAELVAKLAEKGPAGERFCLMFRGYYHSRYWEQTLGIPGIDQSMNSPEFLASVIRGFIEEAVAKRKDSEDMIVAMCLNKGITSIDWGFKIGVWEILK
jgi:hypothetical protein